MVLLNKQGEEYSFTHEDDRLFNVEFDVTLEELIEVYNLCVDELSEKGYLTKKVS